MTRWQTRGRLGVVVLVAGWMLAAGRSSERLSPSPPAETSDALRKVDPRVLEEIQLHGRASFWIALGARADLSHASEIRDWNARGAHVFEALTATADASQGNLRSLLGASGTSYRSFWVVNAIRVQEAGSEVLLAVARQPETQKIVGDATYEVQGSPVGATMHSPAVVEWNIDRIRAPLVWSTFGVRGDGIVVANINTGAQFDHPALVRRYRGNLGGGSFDHNYNWFDPSAVCGNPSLAPCDNNGVGTHTQGTMVGDDGDPGANQIGVAPHARWIAAKGCETNSCSMSALLASGQWILAPTDLSGQNPRPDLRPHIVNNSWGASGADPFFQSTVDAWVAAGIFPAFAVSSAGPGCGTVGSPAGYLNTYSAGAFDINGAIASFSGRGPSPFGAEVKPNISAPGVNIRSSVPGGTYAIFSGTTTASPHVAGTVALLWSFAPALIGDIPATRQLLDEAAIDMSNLTCGGTAGDNNVWGEGALDAFATIAAAGCTDDADCDDGEPCTDDACDAEANCSHANNSATCDDGLFCNGADTCAGGSCSQHVGNPCLSGGDCNNLCNESALNCLSPVGAPCGSGADTTCTDPDSCDGSGACLRRDAPGGTPCDDANPCTSGDTCASGACAGGSLPAPTVTITQPAYDQTGLPPVSIPINVRFQSSDPGGAVVREVVKLDATCVLWDGNTYGDRDGFLSDEPIQITKYLLCQAMARCGFTVLYNPKVRVEATDCGGNVGVAERIIRLRLLKTEVCAP